MRRSLFLFLIVTILLPGCIKTASQTSLKNEGMLESYAYVVGVTNGQFFEFERTDRDKNKLEKDKFFHIRGGAYWIHKVLPGTYHANSMSYHGRNSSSLTAGGRPVFTVDLEPGKITYIGDIKVIVQGAPAPPPPGMPDLHPGRRETAVQFTRDVQNNSEAAKAFIREKYPELSQSLDSVFIYKPAR